MPGVAAYATTTLWPASWGSPPLSAAVLDARTQILSRLHRYLLELKQPALAFHVLERSRARSLLRMLAERPFVAKDLAIDLAEQRKQLDASTD